MQQWSKLLLQSLLGALLGWQDAWASASTVEPLDVALFFPAALGDQLISLQDFHWVSAQLPELVAQMYGEGRSAAEAKRLVRTSSPQLEIAEPSCLRQPFNWKLVAVRLDPFATLAFGDAHTVDQRAALQPELQHREIPQVRLSFQPWCDRRPGPVSLNDSALHVVFNAYQDPGAARTHLMAWRDLRHVIAERQQGTEGEAKVQQAERKWLELLTGEPHIEQSRQTLIGKILELRDVRVGAGVTAEAWNRHARKIQSSDGLYLSDADGLPVGPVHHPLLEDPKGKTWQLIKALAVSFDRPEFLFQIRISSAGSGRLNWIFSNSEYDFNRHQLIQVPVKIYESQNGLPAELLNVGGYDFRGMGETLAWQRATRATQTKVALTHATHDPHENEVELHATIARENRLSDPRATLASTQSCFNCHSSHERQSVALQVTEGHGPREFGYFFRAFGYIGKAPFISRRLLNEVRAEVSQLNALAQPSDKISEPPESIDWPQLPGRVSE